jgi:mRNA interferase MazF
MVTRASQVPDRGDVVFLDFTPQAGDERAGRQPALVLSPRAYNRKTGLCLACPVTNRAKGYPFEVPLPKGIGVTGVVLSDHVKSLDWAARRATLQARVTSEVVGEVLARLHTLLV